MNEPDEDEFTYMQFTMTCKTCGTVYDVAAVDALEFIPPVGDGCIICQPDDEPGEDE